MAGFAVSIPHTLGREAALARVQGFLPDVQLNFAAYISEAHGQWTGDRLDFSLLASGLPVRGTLLVDDTAVHVSGPLPLAALFFRGKIERTIQQELEKLLL